MRLSKSYPRLKEGDKEVEKRQRTTEKETSSPFLLMILEVLNFSQIVLVPVFFLFGV